MIRNGHAGFGRGVSEKDRKAPRRGPTSADPTGEKARGVKARYVGVCRGCGAYTQARNGKGDAYAYCKRCHAGAITLRWSRERVLAAMHAWRERYGRLPSSYDWSRTHARRRSGDALARLASGEWPPASVVSARFGTWAAARAAASAQPADRLVRLSSSSDPVRDAHRGGDTGRLSGATTQSAVPLPGLRRPLTPCCRRRNPDRRCSDADVQDHIAPPVRRLDHRRVQHAPHHRLHSRLAHGDGSDIPQGG